MQLDFSRLRQLGDDGTSEGRKWLLEVVDAYVADTRARLAEVQAAVESANQDVVRALAHQQKGVSAMLGAVGMARRFEAIEQRAGDQAVVRSHLSAIRAALDRLRDEVDRLTSPALPGEHRPCR